MARHVDNGGLWRGTARWRRWALCLFHFIQGLLFNLNLRSFGCVARCRSWGKRRKRWLETWEGPRSRGSHRCERMGDRCVGGRRAFPRVALHLRNHGNVGGDCRRRQRLRHEVKRGGRGTWRMLAGQGIEGLESWGWGEVGGHLGKGCGHLVGHLFV